MKGAILCGSKTYTSWMTEKFIKENYSNIKDWTHLDVSETNKPDIVGSVFDLFTLYKMGIAKYDVVILDICFIGEIFDEPVKEVQILAASLLVRKGGHIVYVNMTRQYLTQMLIRNKETKYYEALNKLYFSDDIENINKAIRIINDIYINLAKNIGIKFLKMERKSRDIENKKIKYDYVIFQK
jgi:hypothetical protein